MTYDIPTPHTSKPPHQSPVEEILIEKYPLRSEPIAVGLFGVIKDIGEVPVVLIGPVGFNDHFRILTEFPLKRAFRPPPLSGVRLRRIYSPQPELLPRPLSQNVDPAPSSRVCAGRVICAGDAPEITSPEQPREE